MTSIRDKQLNPHHVHQEPDRACVRRIRRRISMRRFDIQILCVLPDRQPSAADRSATQPRSEESASSLGTGKMNPSFRETRLDPKPRQVLLVFSVPCITLPEKDIFPLRSQRRGDRISFLSELRGSAGDCPNSCCSAAPGLHWGQTRVSR